MSTRDSKIRTLNEVKAARDSLLDMEGSDVSELLEQMDRFIAKLESQLKK